MIICMAPATPTPHLLGLVNEVSVLELAGLPADVCGFGPDHPIHRDPDDTDMHAVHPVTSGAWCVAFSNQPTRPLPPWQLSFMRYQVTCAACLHALVRADRAVDWSSRINMRTVEGGVQWERRLAGRWFRFTLTACPAGSDRIVRSLGVWARTPDVGGEWTVVRSFRRG